MSIHSVFLNRVRKAREAAGDAASERGGDSGGKAGLNLEELKPEAMTWHDYIILLLQVGAELEHGLMVQYLYGAYSLGGSQVPDEHRKKVQEWQASILAVAREEMGHLICVQNLLVLLGGSLNFGRSDFPYDSPFYPFPFQLEPLSLSSVAAYIYAEMPSTLESDGDPRYDEFRKKDWPLVQQLVKDRMPVGERAHHVDEIYEWIIKILGDEDKIPDSAFNADTYAQQMSWDEWAKGYGPQELTPVDEDQDPPKPKPPREWPARVIVTPMATRTQVLAVLQDIAGQGEAPHLGEAGQEPSHFDRFIEVFAGMRKVEQAPVVRDMVTNPTTQDVVAKREGNTLLTNPRACAWARLANLRYRMLLTYIEEMYALPEDADTSRPSPRPGVLHRVFGEMYNLKAVSSVLVRLPALEGKATPFAGPPFEVPYALDLPDSWRNRWRTHRDLHHAGVTMCGEMLKDEPPGEGTRFLEALRELDRQSITWIEPMLGTPTASERIVR